MKFRKTALFLAVIGALAAPLAFGTWQPRANAEQWIALTPELRADIVARLESSSIVLAATSRARAAVDLLTFVYRDPGDFGDDRAYVVVQGVVRATFPFPSTPIEREAFRAVVAAELEKPLPPPGPLPLDAIDEILLLMSWFRAHPDALRRTTPLQDWAAA